MRRRRYQQFTELKLGLVIRLRVGGFSFAILHKDFLGTRPFCVIVGSSDQVAS